MVGLFYLALAPTLSAGSHIGVEVLAQFMWPRARHVCQAVGAALSAALFVTIAVIGAKRAWGDYVEDAVTSGVIPWPTWVSIAFVPLGSALISLRLALLVFIHARAAVTNIPLERAEGHF
jgi:TRAP-type C4-dicarboxylate transport system permease small subunit